jgi:hypothetical protein
MRHPIRLGEAVPDQHVAVGREALVLRGLRGDEELVHRTPLLRREVERRQAMLDRNDHAATRQDVVRVAGIARGGVDARAVLDEHRGFPKLRQVAEDAIAVVTSAFSRTDGPGASPSCATRAGDRRGTALRVHVPDVSATDDRPAARG